MIKEKDLLDVAYKIDLFEFLNIFFKNQEKTISEAWYNNLGDKIQSWGSKLGNFIGKTKNSLSNAASNFSQAYQNTSPSSNPYKKTPLQTAKKAYNMLKSANLLNNIELKKALEKQISELQTPEKQKTIDFKYENNLSFKDWLVVESSLPKHYRPELVEPQIKKYEVSVGDIVEMGPETEHGGKTVHQGKSIGRLAQVKEIRANEVVVLDLTRAKAKRQIIPISHLYDKEELKGGRIIPKEEEDLKALGGNRLWVKLTPRQYHKFASRYKATPTPNIIQMRNDEPSTALRKMFSQSSEPKKPEVLPMFSRDEKKKPGASPLGKFLSSKKGIFGDLS